MPWSTIPRFRSPLSVREVASFAAAAWPAGPRPVERFEQLFGRHILGGRRVVLAPSGRVALLWLLPALGLEPGDEVVTQAFNFHAVPAAISAAGCLPRFLDVAPRTFEGDWERLPELLGPRTGAVVVTHLFGNPAPVERVLGICGPRGIAVIEDCAQGIGATINGRPAGTLGDGALFSLGPTKNLTLLGGGAASVRSPEAWQRLEALAAEHSRVSFPTSLGLAIKAAALVAATHPLVFSSLTHPVLRAFERRGVDLVHRVMEERPRPMNPLDRPPRPSRAMAAVGLAQLRRLDALNRARVRNGWYLRSQLAGVDGLVVPPMRVGSVFMSFPILHPRREALARELRRRGVDTDLGFMADCAGDHGSPEPGSAWPESARVAREILHLPIHPFLRRRALDRIAEVVRQAVDRV